MNLLNCVCERSAVTSVRLFVYAAGVISACIYHYMPFMNCICMHLCLCVCEFLHMLVLQDDASLCVCIYIYVDG